ncbi:MULTISPECIES: PHB depolymerase family esterase [Massilia]|jgi:poly(hydroxyalkanoate) depolymerase family esterase|uniref:extracellular catalytic domain type 1 short-chain-length polyhydroxyalkanoate depolymerase n=1 Tax=Massilia TaxID=149698 RepID=UPI001C62EB20|nr:MULTISPECIES: PHB depolymerase family esterase [Massilia]QYG04063.1 PHB depolymerase family esterase [Massilia sp. NP310]
MKNLDRFIGQMLESARLARAKDVSGATAVIQQALAQAGLATPEAHPSASAFARQPEFVDLNPAPDWSRHTTGRSVPPRPAARQPASRKTAPGRFIAGSHGGEAGSRRYKLYIPAQPAEGRRPLVVMLHGCTQNPDDFAIGTGMNALAEEFGFLVLYPEQDGRANRSHCWNWFEPGHQARDAGEPGILADMTRQVIREYDAEPSQVFVAGMSAGGAMAAVLGAEYPELFAAIGVHSGLPAGSARDMITGLQAMKKPGRARSLREAVPVIVFHGDADHVVDPGNGEAVLKQFVGAHAGLRATPLHASETASTQGGRRATQRIWRDEEGRAMAEHWILHGAGHTWAGGDAAGSHTDALGPCASREMLRFFLQR